LKLRVKVEQGNFKVDEIVEGDTAEALVAQVQERAAKEAGFLIGAVVRRMTPLQFAQEVTKRYNAATNDGAPLPATCAEFVNMAVAKGFATPVEE
jgi:hypothetical protein